MAIFVAQFLPYPYPYPLPICIKNQIIYNRREGKKVKVKNKLTPRKYRMMRSFIREIMLSLKTIIGGTTRV